MNILNIKKEFPIFNNKVNNNDLVYLDSANSSQKPQVVIDRVNDFYTKEFSNVGRSVHYLAVAATNLYENTRTSVQKYINAKDKNEIVFTKGATEAINLVANTFGQKFLKEGDEILITELEHHSNLVPWQKLAKDLGKKLEYIPIKDDLTLDYEKAKKIINKDTAMLAINHISNALGTINDVKKLIELVQPNLLHMKDILLDHRLNNFHRKERRLKKYLKLLAWLRLQQTYYVNLI